MHIRLRDEAQEDLLSIRNYLEPRSPMGCVRVLSAISTVIDQLASFPFLGHIGRIEGTREISVTRYPYIIVYSLPDEYHIDIEAILHTSMRHPPAE